MDTSLDLTLFAANSFTVQSRELFWLFSRNQLEFILREVELFSPESRVPTAQYGDIVVPVVRLENYFGLETRTEIGSEKYLVLRDADEDGGLHRIMVRTGSSPKMVTIQNTLAVENFKLPENSGDQLGCFALDEDRVCVLPNIVKIARNSGRMVTGGE